MAGEKNIPPAPDGAVDPGGAGDAKEGKKKKGGSRKSTSRVKGELGEPRNDQEQEGEGENKRKETAEEERRKKEEREQAVRSAWGDFSALSGESKEKLGENFAVAVGHTLAEAKEKMSPDVFFKKILRQFIETNIASSAMDEEGRIRFGEELLGDIWTVIQEKNPEKKKEQKIALGEKYHLENKSAENLFKLFDIFSEAWVSLRDREVDPAAVRQQLGEGGGDWKSKMKNWVGAPGGLLFSLVTLFAVVGVLSLLKLKDIMLGKKGKGK